MTIQEALEKIRSKPKWYFVSDGNGGVTEKSYLINTAQRIEDGRAKPETIRGFFANFGYSVTVTMEVSK